MAQVVPYSEMYFLNKKRLTNNLYTNYFINLMCFSIASWGWLIPSLCSGCAKISLNVIISFQNVQLKVASCRHTSKMSHFCYGSLFKHQFERCVETLHFSQLVVPGLFLVLGKMTF